MSTTGEKVLILGIDGGTWKILRPLMESGRTPNLSRLANSGVSGNLRSTVPPVTAPAWTSFQTGVNPGKHGIYDFQDFDKATRESSIVNSSKIPLPTIWDLVTERKKNVVTVNVPMTYPPTEDRNRITVGGLLSPKEGGYIYPEELADPLVDDIGYEINGGPLERRISTRLDSFIERETTVEKKRFEAASYIMDNYDWDLFMLHVQSSDGIQHCFYPYLDSNSPNFEEDKYETIAKFYEELDKEIGKLLEKTGEATKFIISDHGFRELRTYANLNAWLREERYLDTNGPNLLARGLELVRKLDFLKVGKRIIGRFLDDFLPLRNIASDMNTSSINWETSRAFMPNGTVFGTLTFLNADPPAREEIVKKLQGMKEPGRDEEVINRVYEKDDIFEGEKKDQLPDLFLQPSDGYAFGVPMVMEKDVFRDVSYPSDYLGTHAMDGIIIAQGPGIKESTRFDHPPQLYDLAPTVLASLGMDVPGYMDGQVLKSIFTDKPDYKVKDQAIPYRDMGKGNESREVRDRLEDLGYL